MEIMRKNIHMELRKAFADNRLPMAEDRIIPDQYPDVDQICFSKMECEIQEVRPSNESVLVRGQLTYTMLYYSGESHKDLISLKGNLQLEEKLNMPGLAASDPVEVHAEAEDFRIQLINSRKISLQAVIHMEAESRVLKDTGIPESISSEYDVECKKERVYYSKPMVSKKDLYRIREEIEIPSNYPNIEQCLWYYADVCRVETELTGQGIRLKGAVQIFCLYEGEHEKILSFEKRVPFTGEIRMDGVDRDCIADVCCKAVQREISVHPDSDGEMRILHVDVSLDLDIKAYTEEMDEVITDLYSVEEEILPEYTMAHLEKLREQKEGTFGVTATKKTGKEEDYDFRILFCTSRIWQDRTEMTEEGIVVKGTVFLDYLYKSEEEIPYGSDSIQIPYKHVIEIDGCQPEDLYRMQLQMEQTQVTVSSSGEVEAKCDLHYSLILFEKVECRTIGEVKEQAISSDRLGEKPGMCIYVVKAGDSLWEIGKQYGATVPDIMENNHLASEEIQVGDKLFLTKAVRKPSWEAAGVLE